MKKIEEYVRSIPDFPEPGIIFRDITTVLQDADGLQLAIQSMQDCLKDTEVDVIAGTESRGFIFGVPIAYKEKKPFVPVRTIFTNHLYRFVRKVNCHVRQFPRSMIWNMVQRRLRCTKILSNRDRKLLS